MNSPTWQLPTSDTPSITECGTAQVAWHGEQEETLEVRITLSYGYPLVVVKRNGKQDPKFMRDYSSPKRAMNAIREIVRFAGFEW